MANPFLALAKRCERAGPGHQAQLLTEGYSLIGLPCYGKRGRTPAFKRFQGMLKCTAYESDPEVPAPGCYRIVLRKRRARVIGHPHLARPVDRPPPPARRSRSAAPLLAGELNGQRVDVSAYWPGCARERSAARSTTASSSATCTMDDSPFYDPASARRSRSRADALLKGEYHMDTAPTAPFDTGAFTEGSSKPFGGTAAHRALPQPAAARGPRHARIRGAR
jgi:hypothetical protein